MDGREESGGGSTESIGWRLLEGAGAGMFATVPMSAVMLAAQRQGLLGRMPPKTITRRLLRRTSVAGNEPFLGTATTLAHLGFGAAAGALFGAVRSAVPVPAPLTGVAYGLAVWAVSYLGWAPALRLHEHPRRDRRDRSLVMSLSHVVWGAGLGLLIRALSGRRTA